MRATPESTGIDAAALTLGEACAAAVALNFRNAGYAAPIVVVAVNDGARIIAKGVFIDGITNPRRIG